MPLHSGLQRFCRRISWWPYGNSHLYESVLTAFKILNFAVLILSWNGSEFINFRELTVPLIPRYLFPSSDSDIFVCVCVMRTFFSFIFISWRLITLQYCSGFSHTLTWISHGFTCIPHPDPSSHLPLHPIPLGLPTIYNSQDMEAT